MPSVADLVEGEHLRGLAASDALDAGTKLAEGDMVRLDKFGPLEVMASVEEETVIYEVGLRGGEELRWSCTCPEGRRGSFCRHCVAVAREAWRRSPARRTGDRSTTIKDAGRTFDMREGYTVAVVGAGLVGERLVAELRRREFPMKELRILARSARRAVLAGETFEVGVAEPEAFEGVDYALFAGTEGEKGAAVQLAREAIARGAIVIDNGSDFRLHPEVPLVVPEVNAEALEHHSGIIANPNCSTIQMVVSLAPLVREFGVRKVVVSTYQAVSGAGRGGVEALENGREEAFPKPIVGNAIPLIGAVGEDGYTTEEKKMREESRKILSLPDLPVFATAVRIPVHTGHAESVYVETDRDAPLPKVLEVLREAPGVVFSGVPTDFPTPLEAAGEHGVYVGRVRAGDRSIGYWCVADNLLKGAATNAVQIAESLVGARV